MAVAASARPELAHSLPVFQDTMCRMCGRDDAVGVRHHGTVLCLDCYREAARAERLTSRHAASASARRAWFEDATARRQMRSAAAPRTALSA